MEAVRQLVLDTGADVGLAFDGDADRLLAVDEAGGIINGDQILAICGCYLKNRGKLPKNAIVATIMSNLGLFQMGEAGKTSRSPGRRWATATSWKKCGQRATDWAANSRGTSFS